MTIARFKDLCMDASDALQLAGFWAQVLGAQVTDLGDRSARIDMRQGPAANDSIWVDPVPEPRTGKTRVHLDVRLAQPDPAPLLAAGATVVRDPGADPWWVLADPDGNEFCAFPPRAEAGSQPGVFELVVDCADALAQARWWARIVGGRVAGDDGGSYVVDAAGFPWRYWVFQPVPEPKTVKNRVHWDVDLTGDGCAALVDAGARVLRQPGGDISWWVLADPEGNEFCAFPPRRPG
ncbi:MAG TPA: VOC family protein [Micromonosporaceae bacterium]